MRFAAEGELYEGIGEGTAVNQAGTGKDGIVDVGADE